ncbi:MAG: hypothetical protein HY452_02685 [Parcubacteria group bacterium]|nr:hypothetical protein [Parcubacteria group bacterium]
MILNKKTLEYFKFYVLMAGAIVVALFINFVFWFKTRSANRDFLQRNEELSMLTAKKMNLLQFQREGQKMEAIQDQVQSSFVTKDSAVDFIVFIENAARSTANSVKIAAITEESGQPKNFRLELGGSYPGLVNFLAYLENSPYLVRPSRIDVNQASDAAQQSVFRTIVDLEVLSL